MKEVFSKEVKIGIAAIICLILLYVGIEFLKGVNIFKPGNYYIAKYDNVTGLAVSAPVTINGFKVGLVRDIKYDYENSEGLMIVELSLDKNIKLPKGTKALLASDLLGTASIKLELGKNNSSEFYEVGSTLESKYITGLMGDLDTKIMPSVSSILPKIDSILCNINQLTSDPSLLTAIKRLDAISANLEKTTASINKMMSSQLPTTLDNVSAISENINIISKDLTEVSGTLKSLPLDSTVYALNGTLANVEKITDNLNNTNSSLGLLLNDRGLYDHIDSTITDLDSIMIDLRHNPKKYVNFKLF